MNDGAGSDQRPLTSSRTTAAARRRLAAWLEDTQLSNRLGTPIYANPSKLKDDLRMLLAALESLSQRAEQLQKERDEALATLKDEGEEKA